MAGPPWVDDVGSIPDGCQLWRAVPPVSLYPPSPETGQQGFSNSILRDEQMSVYIIGEKTPEAMRAQFPGCRFLVFTAGAIRAKGFMVMRDPDEVGDTSHAVVLRSDKPGSRWSGGPAKELKSIASWAE